MAEENGSQLLPDRSTDPRPENPLTNIMINVLIPVIALSVLSKEAGKPWHMGPLWGMIIAISFPIIYGIYDLISRRKMNLFSVLGITGILLTGGITLYVWNEDGSVKENAAQLFAVKESAMPTILGMAMLFSHWTPNPLLKIFLYTPQIFNIKRIEDLIKERNQTGTYQALLLSTTAIMACSFLISALLNYFLALHFLQGSEGSRITYNAAIGKLTGWGYLVIGLPCVLVSMIAFWRLIKNLRTMTGLETEEIMAPRKSNEDIHSKL